MQLNLLAALAAFSFAQVQGLSLDVTSTDSIKSVASTIATDMVAYYNGNGTTNIPGLLPKPYFWWEGGAMFDTLLQYGALTGDSKYSTIISQALTFQQGSNDDFMPANQTATEGNDDQSTWALAAMSAAELQFPNPSSGPTWISLAEAVFNEQVLRWDVATCNGGLRWQIFTFNNGYNYKNSGSNGFLFQLSSRLARYTGNTTYSDWASKIYLWSTEIGFVDSNFNVYDGAHVEMNCTDINKVQFSYFAGTYVAGAAAMYNATNGDSKWKTTLDGLLNKTLATFFPNGIATEQACESHNTCTTDMYAFKGLLGQQLVQTIQMAPYTSDIIMPKLSTSAEAAAKACSDACKSDWSQSGGSTGLGQQLSALSYVQGLLIGHGSSLLGSAGGIVVNGTATSGGNSSSSSSSTTSGAPTATQSKNAAISGESAKTSVVLGLLGSIAWLVL